MKKWITIGIILLDVCISGGGSRGGYSRNDFSGSGGSFGGFGGCLF